MAKKRSTKHLKKFQFTKADARECGWAKGNRSRFANCMVKARKRRLAE